MQGSQLGPASTYQFSGLKWRNNAFLTGSGILHDQLAGCSSKLEDIKVLTEAAY